MACSPRSFAIATVSRSKDGRCRLDSCLSAAASPDEQTVAVAEWLAAADHQLGAVSGVLDAADYELLHVDAPDAAVGPGSGDAIGGQAGFPEHLASEW